MLRCAALIIGDEICNGDVRDINGAWLTMHLPECGASLEWMLYLNDNLKDIVAALSFVSPQVDVIVLSGGLGPTEDDVTTEAVAKWADRPLERSAEHEAFLKNRLRVWNKAQEKQMYIPQGAVRIHSAQGTACPFKLTVPMPGGRQLRLVSLPGVPKEFQDLWTTDAQPYLFGITPSQVVIEHWYTFGVGEAQLQEMCNHALSQLPVRPPLGFLITPQGVEVKLREPSTEQNKSARDALDRVFHEFTYSKQESHLEKICLELLRQKKLSIAIAESCTGGLLTQLLTRHPGASDVLLGGVVTYADRWKTDFVGVDPELIHSHGAVSEPVVKAMCEGLERRASQADIFISISGIAGPSGGTPEKPVGTVWIGLKRKGQAANATHFQFYGPRVVIQRRGAQAALFQLWKTLT